MVVGLFRLFGEFCFVLTGALREVGDVLVVEGHLVLEHVGQPTQTRATHDAYQWADVRLGQKPVRGGLAVLIGKPAEELISSI